MIMSEMKRLLLLPCLLLVLCLPNISNASLILGTSPFIGTLGFTPMREWGFDFTVGASDVLLTRLGAYDQGQDGLNGTIRVSVWDRSDSSLLVSADITGGALESSWRMVNVSSVILSATNVYSFVATSTFPRNTPNSDILDEFFPVDATGLGTVSTSHLRWEVTTGAALVFPNRTDGGAPFDNEAGMSGVNADIVLAPVPEPTTLLLMGLGLAGLGFMRRRLH